MSNKNKNKMNKQNLIKFFGICVFLIFSATLNAQEKQGETYIIKDNGNVKNVQPYMDALNNADMKHHRLKDKRYIIIFDTGVTVELFSATELIANGRNINIEDYPDTFDSSYQKPIFSIGTNNFILEQHKPIMKTEKH